MEFSDWQTAVDEAAERDMSVVGGLHESGQPFYVLVPKDADPAACTAAAFEAKYGRPFSGTEQFLLKVAEGLGDHN